MEKHILAAKLYAYFYGRYHQIAYEPTKQVYVVSESFIKKIQKKDNNVIGVNFLFDFLSYQFNTFYYMKYKKTFVSYAFGDKAIDRWVNKKAGWNYSVRMGFLKSRKIIKDEVIRSIYLNDFDFDESKLLELNIIEEAWKEKYQGTQREFMCLNYTSMWHPNSKWCKDCVVKSNCKSKMKVVKPRIYKARQNAINPAIFKRASKIKHY